MTQVLAPMGDAARAAGFAQLLPVFRRLVTQEMVNAYAAASGDFNPIHIDPEYAKSGPFGRTVVHGLMILSLVAEQLNRWSNGRFDASGEIDIAFVGPVFPGDTVEVSGTLEGQVDRDGVPCVRLQVICKAGDRQVLAGHALTPIENGEWAHGS